MKLRQLEIFRAVFTQGSVAGAAQALHMSPPAVSRMLSQYEKELKFLLFLRVKGRLIATQEGQILFKASNDMFEQLSFFNSLTHTLKLRESRPLKIGCSPSASQKIVPQAIHLLTTKAKQQRIFLEVSPIDTLVEQLLSFEIDVAVSLTEPNHPDIHVDVLFQAPVVCAFRIGHALEHEHVIKITDLQRFSFIEFHPETTQGSIIAKELTKAGIELKSALTVHSAASALHLVRATGGVTLVDEVSAKDSGQKEIAFRPVDLDIKFKVCLLTFVRNQNANLTKEFKTCLARSLTNR